MQVHFPKREPKPLVHGPPSKKSKLPSYRSAASDSVDTPNFQAWAKLSDEEMLQKVNRCAWTLRAGQHVKDHQCDPHNLTKRVAGIRSDLGANKDPHRKVNFVPKANK